MSKPAVLIPGHHATPDGDFRVSAEQFAESVLRHIPAGVFYRRAGIVGTVLEGAFRQVSASYARLLVDTYVEPEHRSMKSNGKTRTAHIQYVPCSTDLGQVVLDRLSTLRNEGQWQEIHTDGEAIGHPAHSLRLLRAVVPHPVVTSSGRILSDGWHPAYGVLVESTILDAAPIDPRGLLEDFGLDPISEANVLALMLTVLARPCIRGNVPLFVVTAPVAGAGKTMLVDEVVGSVTLGHAVPSMIWPEDGEEIRKTLTAAMLSGSPLLNIDNVPRVLNSEALASFLTTSAWRDRILGRSESVEIPNAITLAATGNQVQASGELARRSVTITIQPGCDCPEMRRGRNGSAWRYPDLRAEAIRQRDGVVAWFLELFRKWADAGRPESGLILGSFGNWIRAVVDPLAHAGLPVLKDVHESAAKLDADRRDLEAIVSAWWETHADVGIYARDVLAIADRVDAWQALIASRNNERGQVTVVGLKLARLVGRVINGRMIVEEDGRKGRVYRLLNP